MAEVDFTVDTDVMVDVLRGHPPALAWLAQHDPEVIGLPVIVHMELLQGARNRQQQTMITERLNGFTLLHLQQSDSECADEWFGQLHLSHGIGILDCLVAATAAQQNVPFYTFNGRHFSVIPGLDSQEPYPR